MNIKDDRIVTFPHSLLRLFRANDDCFDSANARRIKALVHLNSVLFYDKYIFLPEKSKIDT